MTLLKDYFWNFHPIHLECIFESQFNLQVSGKMPPCKKIWKSGLEKIAPCKITSKKFTPQEICLQGYCPPEKSLQEKFPLENFFGNTHRSVSKTRWNRHCVKSAKIRSFFWSIFSRKNADLLLQISVFSPNTGKYGLEKTPYLDTFHAVRESCKE